MQFLPLILFDYNKYKCLFLFISYIFCLAFFPRMAYTARRVKKEINQKHTWEVML
ncbi:hypothetical protein [Oscillospiraceae bacterium]|nr:hypothetical protein [Oscillospiraceae bacterium]